MGMFSPDENGWIPEEEAVVLRRLADVARAMRDMDKRLGLSGEARVAEARRLMTKLFRAIDEVDAYNSEAGGWCGAPKTLVADDAPLTVLSTHGNDDSDRSKPLVELHWVAPTCQCGGETWRFDHAPEGGFMVQCLSCHTTRTVVFESNASPSGGLAADFKLAR